jgi:hypothetical protein
VEEAVQQKRKYVHLVLEKPHVRRSPGKQLLENVLDVKPEPQNRLGKRLHVNATLPEQLGHRE